METQLDIRIVDDDNEILELIIEGCDKSILKRLDEDLKTHGGVILTYINYNNERQPCLLMKFIGVPEDSGLILYISRTNTINPFIPLIKLAIEEFKINMSLEEFIENLTTNVINN